MNGYMDCVDGTANIKLMMNWFAKMTVRKYQNQELGLEGIPELEAVYAAMETYYKKLPEMMKLKCSTMLEQRELGSGLQRWSQVNS